MAHGPGGRVVVRDLLRNAWEQSVLLPPGILAYSLRGSQPLDTGTFDRTLIPPSQ
jgi:hypothetical protein